MKINYLTLCLMAVAGTAMTGCSNDEPSSSAPVFQGDTAYLNVKSPTPTAPAPQMVVLTLPQPMRMQ